MDEPHPWATLTLHDSVIFKDNDFEVSFDPSQKPGVFHFPGSNSNSKNANPFLSLCFPVPVPRNSRLGFYRPGR